MATPQNQDSVSNIWDMFTGLANIYVQDRQAQREQAAQYNLYAYQALASADNSNLQNHYAQPIGEGQLGHPVSERSFTVNDLLIGGAVIAALILVLK